MNNIKYYCFCEKSFRKKHYFINHKNNCEVFKLHEQNEIQKLSIQQKYMEDIEWDKGTNNRNILRKQQQEDKQLDKIRRKRERQDILDEEG